jgi:predicted AlkP superfamily phosphohydrolase/phosphomutase
MVIEHWDVVVRLQLQLQSKHMRTPKIMIIGLDAATWDLLGPWAARGLLPNLSRLMESGASADLQSVIPPLTPPAWTSFMTGSNPGKHGIFYFLEPQPGSYSMRYANAGSRRATTFFRVLCDAGLTVGSMNVPFTYPPEPLNGFQISGMDAPSEKCAFIHPPSLRHEIERKFGKISFDITHLGFMYKDDRRDRVLAEMKRLDEQWTKIGLYLLEHHPADVMMFTFMSIDTVQHHFWQFMDSSHFLHDTSRAQRYGDAILSVYQRLDETVGRFAERVPQETAIMIVSDHGGGPTSDRVLYLNRFLAQFGLLKYRVPRRRQLEAIKQRATRAAYKALYRTLGPAPKKFIAALFPGMRERFEAAYTSFADIDWSDTKAYCSEVLASPPSIWINKKHEKPCGIVDQCEYEALLSMITQKLADLKDPRNGRSIVPRVYRRDELFHGSFVNEAPDLILDWWSGDGFSISPSLPEHRDRPALQIRKRALVKEAEWGGTHRLNGILIASGKPFRRGVQITGARIIDVAPTVLHLMGQGIPQSMDGRVLVDALDGHYVQEHPVQFARSDGDSSTANTSSPYSTDEAALVEERLKALGYIE